MQITEDFKSLEDFKNFHKDIMSKLIKVDEYIYFALMYSNHYAGGDPLEDIRDAYESNSEELINLFRIKVCSAYVSFVTGNNFELAADITEDAIKDGLVGLMHGDTIPVVEVYDTYLFPYSRVKFVSEFFDNIVPVSARNYINLLIDNSFISFKKSYALLWDMPYTDNFASKFKDLDFNSYKNLDVNQIIKDLYETINFYKNECATLKADNENLYKVIDQLSQQVTNQTLTRWY